MIKSEVIQFLYDRNYNLRKVKSMSKSTIRQGVFETNSKGKTAEIYLVKMRNYLMKLL